LKDYTVGKQQSETPGSSSQGGAKAPENPGSIPGNPSLVHAQMYAMGDKYLIPDLKTYARQLFKEAFSTQEGVLMGDTIIEVYSSTPENDRSLRDIVLDTLLAKPISPFQDVGFRTAATDVVPKFRFDFLGRMFDKIGSSHLYYVPHNGRCYCGSLPSFTCSHGCMVQRMF
jgi:hypothetical protein